MAKKIEQLSVIDKARIVFTIERENNKIIKPYFKNWSSLFWGTIGGIAPMLSHVIATSLHPLSETNNPNIWQDPMTYVWTFALIGFLTFSAKTVYEWLSEAFRSSWKALGITVGIELVMVFGYSKEPTISIIALGFLILINWVATSCQLVLDASPKRKPAKGTKVKKTPHNKVQAANTNNRKAA